MDDMNAFERQVIGQIQRFAGPPRPVDDGALFAALSTAPRSAQWRMRMHSMFGATKLVVAGAIVALFAGLLATGVLPPSPDREAPGAVGTADGSPTASLSPTPSPDAVVPRYEATASLRVDPGPDAGPDELRAAEEALRRYAAMAQSREVAEAVIAQLRLDESPESLLERTSAVATDEALVLSLHVSDDDAVVALRIATALGDEVHQRVEKEAITSDTRATDQAIRRIERDLGRLRDRLNNLRSRPNKSPSERQEILRLSGEIAALAQTAVDLRPSSSTFVRNRLKWLDRPSISGQEEPGERPPQAEPSAAASRDPAADDAVTTTRFDLVPGVDLVTEEVEPGVFRVVSDGVRDLRRPVEDADLDPRSAAGRFDRSLHAAPDGSIWVFDPDGAFRLGQTDVIDVEWLGAAPVIDDSPDGSMWTSWGHRTVLGGSEAIGFLGRLQDGAWQGRELGPDWWSLPLADIAVGPDGTLWAALWSGGCAEDASTEDGPCGAYVAPLVAPLDQSNSDELEGMLAPRLSKDHEYQGVVGLWATEDGSVWLLDAWKNRRNREIGGALSRFDGTSFERHGVPTGSFVRADIAADGTMWAIIWDPEDPKEPKPTLARFDGSEWTTFEHEDGVPPTDGTYYWEKGGFFIVAPDRSVWLNPTADTRRAQGVARFDGGALQRYLQDLRVYAMDVAPDGSVWLEAGSYSVSKGKEHLEPIDMYVITPEAIAATE